MRDQQVPDDGLERFAARVADGLLIWAKIKAVLQPSVVGLFERLGLGRYLREYRRKLRTRVLVTIVVEALGDSYRGYMKRTKRLIPFLL